MYDLYMITHVCISMIANYQSVVHKSSESSVYRTISFTFYILTSYQLIQLAQCLITTVHTAINRL